ncbi:MAG: hypothetical protein ACYC27_14100 [Armatimonadota bacterium]
MEREAQNYQEFFIKVSEKFNQLGTRYVSPPNGRVGYFMQLRPGNRPIHYECRVKTSEQTIDVGLHFELKDHVKSMKQLDVFTWLKPRLRQICTEMNWEFYMGTFGGKRFAKSSEITFRIPYDGNYLSEFKVSESVKAMKLLIDATEETLYKNFDIVSS